MGKPFLLFLSLCLLVLFHGSLARRQYQQLNECQLDKLNALEPDRRINSEGGRTEFWNPNQKQFQCAGVAILKRIIERNGLLLPSYSNSPQLVYVVQGRGLTGVIFPGCPETYQESQESGGSFRDKHQKIRRFREGDVIALPAGVAHWCYNDGNEDVVLVSLFDTSNSDNQLDNNPREFYLAGNPQGGFQQEERKQGAEGTCNNVLCGIYFRFLAEAFNIDEETAKKLQSRGDKRGSIVKTEGGLDMIGPHSMQQEEREEQEQPGLLRVGKGNGIEETFCTLRVKENIGDPSRADIYDPEAGRIRTINSFDLPILQLLQLSVQRGVLYKNALVLPHWNPNAHSIVYVIKGQARIQMVNEIGQTVFNGVVRAGQVLTVPQNFVIVKRCEVDRFEWVAFKTNDQATTSLLAGPLSAFRAMPTGVLAQAAGISTEDAKRIKFGREGTYLAKCQFESRAVA